MKDLVRWKNESAYHYMMRLRKKGMSYGSTLPGEVIKK